MSHKKYGVRMTKNVTRNPNPLGARIALRCDSGERDCGVVSVVQKWINPNPRGEMLETPVFRRFLLEMDIP